MYMSGNLDSGILDCKTVRIFAYLSTREQSNKRSRTRLKTESETGERRFFFLSPHMPYGRVRLARFARVRLLRHALPISLLILRKKPAVLQSTGILVRKFLLVESVALEFLIHLMESRIPPTTGIWTPKSTANESRIHNVESRIQDS